MNLTKNKKYHYLFFLLITIISIFNGGNSDILIQFNSILWSLLFILCTKDKNYHSHLKYFSLNIFSKYKNIIPKIIIVRLKILIKGMKK